MQASPAPAEQPLVSIILSSYNYGRYLRQAVDSVLGQTYEHFELLAVDDGSADDSVEILQSYQDVRLRVMPQTNAGQASAWNRGFAASRGELILFLDSDDWWESNKVERMVEMHRVMGGRYGVLQHNLAVLRDGTVYPYRRILPVGDCFAELKQTGRLSYFVTSSGLGVPRWIADKVFPIPETLRVSPDAFLTRAAFVYGPVMSIPELLGHLRLHGDNAGMTQSQEFHDNLRRDTIFPALNAFYRNNGVDFEYQAPVPDGRFRRLARRVSHRLLG
jgi:glycosyltransferase involved in cell wall biosynthesis